MPVDYNIVAVFYTFEKEVYYVLLKKEKDEWYVARQRKMLNESFGYPIKLLTKETFESVLKPFLYTKA